MDELTLFEHWKQCWTKDFANFNGRARRREFWGFVLFNIILSWAILMLLGFFSGATSKGEVFSWGIYESINSLMSVAVLIPSLAAGARRLHDTGRSAWWLLVGLVPFVGIFVLIVFFCLDSQIGENKWGPNPKEPNLHQ